MSWRLLITLVLSFWVSMALSEDKPVKFHYIGLPGAILVKVEDVVFQSKVRIEVQSPVRADAFHAVNRHAPLISHRLNLAFSSIKKELLISADGKAALQGQALDIVKKIFTDTGQKVEATNVYFTEYLIR